MLLDAYTKCVLSVIALALSAIAIQGFLGRASATYPDIQRVQLCDQLGCAELAPVVSFPPGGGMRTTFGLRVVGDSSK